MTADYKFLASDADMRLISQMQNGALLLSSDGSAAIFNAGPAGDTVGKSALSAQITPISVTDPKVVVVNFSFMIPDGGQVGSIMIADFESSVSEIATNPGVRINMQDGYLRVDRSKLGEPDPWHAQQTEAIRTDQWNDLEIRVTPGVGSNGVIEIYLNSELVLSKTGDTVLTAATMAKFGITAPDTELDRIQIGLTANSNDEATAIAIRDIEISVDGKTVLDSFESAVTVAEAVYANGTENAPVIVEANPDASYFGLNLEGSANADVLIGDKWDDSLYGNGGADTLFGGGGTDVLNGGGGSDSFIFRPGMGNDVIEDFQAGTDLFVFDLSERSVESVSGDGVSIVSSIAFDPWDLSGTDTAEGLLVHYRGDSFLLEGVTQDQLSDSDFLFV